MSDVYHAEKMDYRGLTFIVEHAYDPRDHYPPWEECDGHGPVRTGREAGPGERPLSTAYFYAWDEALTIAKRDRWGTAGDDGLNSDAKALRAVERDFEYLRAWCRDEWHYCGVIVILEGTDISRSLWGIESNAGEYLDEVARELADEIIAEAPSAIEEECTRLRELAERIVALAADVATCILCNDPNTVGTVTDGVCAYCQDAAQESRHRPCGHQPTNTVGVFCSKPAGHEGDHGDKHEHWPE